MRTTNRILVAGTVATALLSCLAMATFAQEDEVETGTEQLTPRMEVAMAYDQFWGQSGVSVEAARACGGIARVACPAGLMCVDDPRDDCDTGQGHVDCAGLCTPPSDSLGGPESGGCGQRWREAYEGSWESLGCTEYGSIIACGSCVFN